MATSTQARKEALPHSAPIGEDELREIRRANFALLTNYPGSKTRLAALTGLSAANISHRLHGNKIFDDATGVYFSEKLGLPSEWFETPHEAGDIPAEALILLTGGTDATPTPTPARKPRSVAVPAAAKTGARSGPSSRVGTAGIPSALAPTHAATPSRAPAPSKTSGVRPSAPTAPAARVPGPTPRTALAAATGSAAEAAIRASGGNVGPVVQALLHTLAAKANAGRLSDEQALKMLVDIATL